MRILFTGGGTAGHVMPNIALIKRLQAEGWETLYVGSKDGMEKELIEQLGTVPYFGVSSGKMRRYFSWKNFTDVFRVAAGYFQAKKIIRREKPDVIFSKGGFVSVPVVAASGKIPVVAHESDYTPGLANRIAERWTDVLCVTFSDTASKIKHARAVHTGTPIRGELFEGDRERGLKFAGLSGQKPVLLVMGGSSGAASMNELVRGALDRLLPVFDVIHLCGKDKVDTSCVREGYRQYEYIGPELPDLLAATDVIVSRAGANAIFEFLALAKPAVLIPLPLSASRGDQILNADYFARKGYAIKVDQDTATPDTLADAVAHLYENRMEYHAHMTRDEMLDGTDEVLAQIRGAVRQ